MQESVTYQAILEEGHQAGIQEGRQFGLQEGRRSIDFFKNKKNEQANLHPAPNAGF